MALPKRVMLTRYTVWVWPDGGCWSDSGCTWRCSVWVQTARRWSISLQTVRRSCMLTFSIPLAAAVASCWRRLIFIACLVTAVGLTCACAEFFAQYVPLSYRTLVFILGGFSMVVSNLA